MNKTIGRGDTTFDKDNAIALREDIITLRDAALQTEAADWAVTLSHCVAFMHHAIQYIWPVYEGEMSLVEAAMQKLKTDLAWQSPVSGRSAAHVALTREQALALLQYLAARGR